MPDQPLVQVERHGAWLRLTLDRPDSANAISTQLADELVDALAAASTDVHVVSLTGRGRWFCAGADLKERVPQDVRFAKIRNAIDTMASFEGITIAAINGFCLGGGLELALACDLRVASAGAVLGLPEISFGMLPAAGGPQRLARTVGAAQAKWLVASGEKIDAARALEIGLVSHRCPAEELDEVTASLATTLSERAAYAVRTAKRVIDHGLELSLADALEQEYDAIDGMATAGERADARQRAASRSDTYARLFTPNED